MLSADAGGRWATDPERIDPDDYPPRQPFVKLLTWAPCLACDRQVHALLTRVLLQGLVCPSCGRRLLEAPEDSSEALAEALRREDLFSAEIE
jgi:DNA-directed RNA polymerase subunit RPC12/RpoP